MRVLFTCLPGLGHLLPMVPLARALQEAGHEVAFATAADLAPEIERRGFAAFPAGIELKAQLREAAAAFPEQAALPPGRRRFEEFVPRMLAGVAAPRRAEDLVPVIDAFAPDLVVHDETEFGAPVAAAAAGIPYADHSVGILRPFAMAHLARATIAPLWERYAVDLGPFAGLFRYLYLDVCPPSLQAEHIAAVDVAHQMENVLEEPGGALPDWVDDLPPVPTVYVTLGTVFNRNRDVFASVLEGVRGERLNVIVTVGNDQDPRALGPQPDNVHIERFIPQASLLPRCDVVVNQGGTAILSVLAHGLPLLVLPQGANQFHNAQACVDAGVARQLLPGEVAPDAVRAALRSLLADDACRDAARRIAGEFRTMPRPRERIALLEQLARERRPLVRGEVRGSAR